MERFTLSMIAVMLTVIMFVSPAATNPVETTLTNYSVYLDNQPIEDSITFSVKCYGTYIKERIKATGWQAVTNGSGNELVYSFTLSCDPGTCFKDDTYKPTWRMNISSCDLEGIYRGKPFLEKNFTIDPEPTCYLPRQWKFNGTYHYYALSFEDERYCYNKSRSDTQDKCDRFLQPIKTGEKPKRVTIFNGTRVNMTPEYLQCVDKVENEQPLCYENHTRVVNSTVLIGHNAALWCEKRFDISSENRNSLNVIRPTATTSYTPEGPVEYLYCSIVQFLGGRCE